MWGILLYCHSKVICWLGRSCSRHRDKIDGLTFVTLNLLWEALMGQCKRDVTPSLCNGDQNDVMFHFGVFNSLWPSYVIWRHRSGSTLAQVMVCCLTAPSHYLNQCWHVISKVLRHSSEGIIMRRSEDTNQWNKIENSIFRIAFGSPRGQWVNVWMNNSSENADTGIDIDKPLMKW